MQNLPGRQGYPGQSGVAQASPGYIIEKINKNKQTSKQASKQVNKQKSKQKNKQKKKINIQILVVSESIGITIPLAYLACLVVVYDGPNAVNLGDSHSKFS